MKINLAGIQIATGQKAQEQELAELRSKLDAIEKSQAVIEFDLEGRIVSANNNFLNTMGYMLDEVIGQHHNMFVDSDYANSNEYIQFWDSLRHGEYQTAEFKRVAKDGSHVWIQATYTPIKDIHGKVIKVVKFATEITDSKMASANCQGQIDAINRAQAVIEFELDGTIITANENFLNTMGYSLNEIRGKHHSLFVDEQIQNSQEYQLFWQDLSAGIYHSGEFKRVSKTGQEIWIQASYNPILDADGNPLKVVKFATDITEQKAQAVQNAKNADISSALKLCNANVMLADNNMTIVYLNDGMQAMLKDHESELQKQLPNFSADTLIGTCVDVFHKNPSMQRDFINDIEKTTVSRLKLNHLTLVQHPRRTYRYRSRMVWLNRPTGRPAKRTRAKRRQRSHQTSARYLSSQRNGCRQRPQHYLS